MHKGTDVAKGGMGSHTLAASNDIKMFYKAGILRSNIVLGYIQATQNLKYNIAANSVGNFSWNHGIVIRKY